MPELLTENSEVTFRAVITDQHGTPRDLTNSTVKLEYKINGGTKVSESATITNATSGIAEYQMDSGELAPSGQIEREWITTDTATGADFASEGVFRNDIRPRLS